MFSKYLTALWLMAIPYSTSGMDVPNQKESLHLVVGSIRYAGEARGPLVEAISGLKAADLSHTTSFNGLATTMHELPCKIENKNHIIGNVLTYDFSKFDIQSVLLDRLPTFHNGKSYFTRDIPHPKMYTNYIGGCINNLAKSMRPGAIMDIEWLPNTSLICSNKEILDNLNQENPFRTFLDMNITLQSIFVLGGDVKNLSLFDPGTQQIVLSRVEKLRALLISYNQQGVGESLDHLVKTIYWEARVLLEMISKKSCILLDYPTIKQDYIELTGAIKKARFCTLPPAMLGQKVAIDTGSSTIIGILYNEANFLECTFLNYVLADLAAELNRPYVLKYLETIDFDLLSFQKGENPHTKLKNVWMIKLKKR